MSDLNRSLTGHLSPYVDGAETDIGGGLPLGIDEASEYEEVQLTLECDAQLVFLSDGVIEARTTAGELFGFDRTLAISKSSAAIIARSAQAFGQEDDITVLTIMRTN